MARRPPLLAIHVQAPGGAKVVFPTSLDVGADCGMDMGVPPVASGRSYSLVSAVQHVGVDGAGHYVAFRREPHIVSGPESAGVHDSDGWLCADDARMLSVTEARVMAARPYLLVYMADTCADKDHGIAAARMQVAHWSKLQETFQSLVDAPSNASSPLPVGTPQKGQVAPSKVDQLQSLREQLGLLPGNTSGLVTVGVAVHRSTLRGASESR